MSNINFFVNDNDEILNNIQFRIDNNDKIIYISYEERFDDEINYYEISLEQELAKKYFIVFIEDYSKNLIQNIEDDYIAYDFSNIDVVFPNEMIELGGKLVKTIKKKNNKVDDSLINLVNKNANKSNNNSIYISKTKNEIKNNGNVKSNISSINNNSKNNTIEKKPKINRKRKFSKRKLVSIEAAVLAALTIFCNSKLTKVNEPLKLPDLNEYIEEIEESFKDDSDITQKNNKIHTSKTTISKETEENIEEESSKTTEEEKSNVKDQSSEVEEESIAEINNDIIPSIISIPSDEKPANINELQYDVLSLRAEDWTDTEKYQIAKAYYYDAICKYANMYGLDSNVVLAIATHENGLHSDVVNSGGAIGLFQIQVEGDWNWNNQQVKAYNFDTNSWETKIISKDEVSDVFENIKVGCMILQNAFREQEYNVPRAIQSYNYGTNYMEAVLNTCCNAENCTREDLKNQYNLSWLKYRNIIQNGDQEYLENIFKYIQDGTQLTFKTPNGDSIEFIYKNLNETRVM